MWNFGYHAARAQGWVARRAYAAALPFLAKPLDESQATLPFDVFSYSGESALPEQVASIRSLLRHAGRPRRFTVVSDGTYSERSCALLRALDPVVEISSVRDWSPTAVPNEMSAYLRDHPTGRQLALIMSLPVAGPAFYIDSDVLFFQGAHQLAELLAEVSAPAAFLADCQLSSDERLLRTAAERENPVNTGVLFLREKLDWSLAFQRFLELPGAPNFFTNQTLTHLVLHANHAIALDPRRFVLQLDDQFVYPDRHAGPGLVLRHYVNPVRHKFWTSLTR